MNEGDLIARMQRHQIKMKKIEKLFFFSGVTCVVINAMSAIGELLLIPVYMYDGSVAMLMQSVAAIASVAFSVFSSCKKEKWTFAALFSFLFRVLMILYSLIFINESELMFLKGALILFLGAVPQFLCMRKYDELYYLKSQFGYPGFNSEIYIHRSTSRRSTATASSSSSSSGSGGGTYRSSGRGPSTNPTSYTGNNTSTARPVSHERKNSAPTGSMDSVEPPHMSHAGYDTSGARPVGHGRRGGAATMDSVEPPPTDGVYEDIHKKPL